MSENQKQPFVNITRLLIETISPMAIHSGGRELGFDNQLARDANDLPYIPASTIAGVWRHMAHQHLGETKAKAWFGSNDEDSQHASVLQINNGDVHNQDNQPQNGLISQKAIEDDNILSLLVQNNPHKRERVRINDMGSAVHEGKFDQILLPTGTRFTIDIRWDNTQSIVDDDLIQQWQSILNIWSHPYFAFGSSTKNGLGRFKIINSYDERLQLEDQEKTIQTLVGFNNRSNNPKVFNLQNHHKIEVVIDLKLQADSAWRCGTSEHLLDEFQSEKSPKILTYSEKTIEWTEPSNGSKSQGSLSEKAQPILCGSSIKGILAHRITYHHNRFACRWATDDIGHKQEDWETRPDEINDLFGKKSDGDNDIGAAGRLMVADCEVKHEGIIHRTHNTINRFTGGVMPQALFSEELLYRARFNILVYLTKGQLTDNQQKAIDATIDDLKKGRLSIGSATGRGTSTTKLYQENK